MTQQIKVPLKDAPYSIFISGQKSGWLKAFPPLSSASSLGLGLVLMTSPRVAKFCLPILKKELGKQAASKLKMILVPDGEKNKNLASLAKIYDQMARLKVDRSATVLLLGGGVVGDMGGFAAATYLRGLPFIQIPTTLVGQIDSAIGGKLGIDLKSGKNLVGAFCQPQAVFCHAPFLKTLPSREIRGGLAEAIKYGIIKDPKILKLIESADGLTEIIERSAKIKAQVISEDEKETKGLRMILNFGHTFGHALERLTHYEKYLHGEAVAIGMVIAARLSRRFGFCSQADAQEVERVIKASGLPIQPPRFSSSAWVKALEIDKKARGGMIHFVFMTCIGKVAVQPMAPSRLVDAFEEVFSR